MAFLSCITLDKQKVKDQYGDFPYTTAFVNIDSIIDITEEGKYRTISTLTDQIKTYTELSDIVEAISISSDIQMKQLNTTLSTHLTDINNNLANIYTMLSTLNETLTHNSD